MKEMWNARYRTKEYAYGIEPNAFFKSALDKYTPKGSILLAAEGEGRNAVYAAKKELEAFAFDISKEGKKKALELAESNNVRINYEVGDFQKMGYAPNSLDNGALIFAHFPPQLTSIYHQKISEIVKPGGLLILEGFSKKNLPQRIKNPKIGGPDKIEMLFSIESIKEDFYNFDILELSEGTVTLQEGLFHNGVAEVVRFIGRKKEAVNVT